VGLQRKLKRKKVLSSKKDFVKKFKKTMEEFKNNVKCSVCGKRPEEGKTIDNWMLKRYNTGIKLACESCAEAFKKEENSNED
tara:strand:- start:2106 stop:2351 length:246 start_codon:yes stop_codon:yes gene_type:complete